MKAYVMKTYVWKDRLGCEYAVFARSVSEAKIYLCRHYDGKDLNRLLFNRRVSVRKMPRGLCNMDPFRTKWLH